MWKVVVAVVVILFAVAWIASYGSWHLDRNRNNILPVGLLKLDHGNVYADSAGRQWLLQPHSANIFHQPDKTPFPAPPIPVPYPNIIPPPEYDGKYPNLKFLSLGDKGDSFEVIIETEGTFLLKGPKQGTYNYGHPSGFWGYTKHVVLDVIPHLFNSNYR